MNAENETQCFYQLFQIIISGQSTNEMNQADATLQQYFQDPNSIFVLLNLLSPNIEHLIRHFAQISLRKILENNKIEILPEKIDLIKNCLYEIIQNEPIFQYRRNLCELVVMLQMRRKSNDPWSEIYMFATNMLQTEHLFTTGLYLWQLVVIYLNPAQVPSTAPMLFETSIKSLSSPDTEVRINGIKLLAKVIDKDLNVDFSQQVEIVQSIFNVINIAFYQSQNVEEAHEVSKVVSDILSATPQIFDNNDQKIAQLGVQIAADESLPLKLRVAGFDLIGDNDNTGGYRSLLDDGDVNKIHEYLTVFIDLMIQIRQSDRISSEFDFARQFFHLAGATIEGDDIFVFFMTVCMKLMENGDFVRREVSLLLLTSIVESQQEFFSERLSAVLQYFFMIADVNDEYVLIYAFRFLTELAEFTSDALTPYVDQISAFCLKHCSHQDSLNTLDLILKTCTHPPRDLQNFLSTLINLLNGASIDLVERILGCIGSTFSHHLSTPIEPLYGQLEPFLLQVLNGHLEDLYRVVIRVIGSLTNIAPLSCQKNIEKLMQILMPAFGNENTGIVCQGIRCVAQFITNMALSMVPYVQELMARFLLIAQQYPIMPHNSESDTNDVIMVLHGEIYCCIAAAVRYMPQHVSEIAPQFFSLLVSAPDRNLEMISTVCSCVIEAASGFKSLGLNCMKIVIPFGNRLGIEEEAETVMSLHNAFAELVTVYDYEENASDFETIKGHLINGIEGQYVQGYLLYELSCVINPSLIPSIFNCLKRFIFALGPYAVKYYEAFKNSINHYLNSPINTVFGAAIDICATLCYVTKNSTDELFDIALGNSIKCLKNSSINLQTSIATSLRMLLLTDKEKLLPFQEEIVIHSEQMINSIVTDQIDSEKLKYAYVSLWCCLVVEYGLNPGDEPFSDVLSTFPPPNETEDLQFAANFVVYAMQRWPEAVGGKFLHTAANFLAEKNIEWAISRMQPNVVLELMKGLVGQSQEQLEGLLCNHQGKLMKLMTNLQKLSRGIVPCCSQ